MFGPPRFSSLTTVLHYDSYEGARVYQMLAAELIRESQHESCRGLVPFLGRRSVGGPATLDLLSYLARRIAGEKILLLFTYRREDAPGLSGWLDRLSERRAVSTLSLNRLLQET